MSARLEPALFSGHLSDRDLAKRQHAPYRVIDNCPACGQETEVNLTGEDSLYCARIGLVAKVHFGCHRIQCAHDWTVLVRPSLTLELIP